MTKGTLVASLVHALALPGFAAPPAPAPEDVLRRAGERASWLEEQLAVTTAKEEYSQGLLVGRDASPRARRNLVSDVVWVRTGDAMVWAFFRDVQAVDGEPLADREGRLARLFAAGASPETRQAAARLLEESARYNLGTRRTVNTPTLGLSVLHPRNQRRFRFGVAGVDTVDGVRLVKLRFLETGRPALTRTSQGGDVPIRGTLWVETERGDLARSEVRFDLRAFPAEIKVVYRPQPRLGAWLPAEMREAYGNRSRPAGEDRLETTARYSDYRKAEVEVQEIRPVP